LRLHTYDISGVPNPKKKKNEILEWIMKRIDRQKADARAGTKISEEIDD
jgi:hypothetical protein